MINPDKVRYLERPLPEVLLGSENYRQLSPEQANNLRGRLKYIEEIAKKIDEWVFDPQADFGEYLDDIELDLAVNQGAPRGDTVVSAWLVHTSWSFGTSPHQLRGLLSPKTLSALDSDIPRSTCSAEALVGWIGEQSGVIKEVLDQFYGATSYAQVIAQLTSLDVLVAKLLLATYRARLNASLPR